MTDEELREVAAQWLAPVDEVFADLIDKSYRMTAGAFQAEVQSVIERIPNLFYLLDKRAFETSLEDEMGKAFIKSLEKVL
jgi:predicted GNAT superfamily acetyltransferase